MNNTRMKIGVAAAATLVLFAVLTLIFWDFMRDTIVTPLYYLVWVSDLFLQSLPQGVYLVFIVVLSIVIGSSALQSIHSKPLIQHAQRPRSLDSARYGFWRRIYDHLTGSQFSRNHFAMESRKLILSILAYQEGVDVSAVETGIMNGSLNVPNAVKYLIQHREIPASVQTSPGRQNFISRLRNRFFKQPLSADPHIDRQVDEIVEFIEHRLEINHAGTQPKSPT